MSDTDSFIEEVTEEVRRERLYTYMRRYGWIAVLLVIFLVGATAYKEYSNASEKRIAENTGDGILRALKEKEVQERIDALKKLAGGTEKSDTITSLLIASELAELGQPEEMDLILRNIINKKDLDQVYLQLVEFKKFLLNYKKASNFEAGAEPTFQSFDGSAYQLLYEEQVAISELDAGEVAKSIERLSQILENANVTQNQYQRISQLLLALEGKQRAKEQ